MRIEMRIDVYRHVNGHVYGLLWRSVYNSLTQLRLGFNTTTASTTRLLLHTTLFPSRVLWYSAAAQDYATHGRTQAGARARMYTHTHSPTHLEFQASTLLPNWLTTKSRARPAACLLLLTCPPLAVPRLTHSVKHGARIVPLRPSRVPCSSAFRLGIGFGGPWRMARAHGVPCRA